MKLLPALALSLLLAGCATAQPAGSTVSIPPAAPTSVPLSFSPVRDAAGQPYDLAGASWAICFQSHDRRGEAPRCHAEAARVAEVAAAMGTAIETLPNRGGYDELSDELSTVVARHTAYVRDGCEAGFARDSQPCTGHLTQMAVSWSSAGFELEKIEPTR